MIRKSDAPLVKDVLAALNDVVLRSHFGQIRSGLKRLREATRAVITGAAKPGMSDQMTAHLFARKLFESGARIVAAGRTQGESKTPPIDDHMIRRKLAVFATSMLNERGVMPCAFRYKAVVVNSTRLTGRELVSVEVPDIGALVAYAFWLVTPHIPLKSWSGYRSKVCPVCGSIFRHGRRVVCSDQCRDRQDRHVKPGERK